MGVVLADEMAAVVRRNQDLEKELMRSKERERDTQMELERTMRRLRIAEEAEERLSFQLGDLEAESMEEARIYFRQIKDLREQLEQAQTLIRESFAIP